MVAPNNAVDVEFETLGASNKGAVQLERKPETQQTVDTEVDAGQLAVFGRRSNAQARTQMSLPVFTLVASIAAVAAFYLSGGHVLFSTQTTNGVQIATPAENVTGFAFENIITENIRRNNANILSIQATILNKGAIARTIPPIMVEIGKTEETRRTFRIKRGETLNPGERLVFTNTVRTGDVPGAQAKLSFLE